MTTAAVPQLLYHNPRAIPYPTNDPSTSLLAVRLASPVRISSIRIAPEGVQTVNGIGCTFPSRWTGKVYLNLSTSSPVNALASSVIEYKETGWELDYPIDMPEDVTTRLLLLESPAERLTISIYGHSSSSSLNEDGIAPGPSETTNVVVDREDWSWLSSWAGGPHGLYALLRSTTEPEALGIVEECLDLLVDVDPSVLTPLATDPEAMAHLRQSTSPSGRSLWRRLQLEQPKLHREASGAPHVETMERMGENGKTERTGAWRMFEDDQGSLLLLAQSQPTAEELLAISPGYDRSNLSRLLDLASTLAERAEVESKLELETVLDILSVPPNDPILLAHLASILPRLYVVSRLRGSSRSLPIDAMNARRILKALVLVSTEVIDGQNCWTAAQDLAQPYLSSLDPNDPLQTAFEPHKPRRDSVDPSFGDTEDGRRLARFDKALTTSHPAHAHASQSSGIVHQLTPAELVSLIAPAYYPSLRTARIPPLGIPPLSAASPTGPQTQASAFGGKVYSLHEFRRERDAGGVGGSGLGVGAGGRPASRHVDDFAMA